MCGWGREFAQERSQAGAAARLEEVRVRGEVDMPLSGEVELCLGKGRSLRVGRKSDLGLVATCERAATV